MIMVVWDAQIPQDRWAAFEQAYAAGQSQRPSAIRAGFLLQDTADPTQWYLAGMWESREAFETFRQSGATSPAQLMFRAVDVEPNMSILDFKAHFGV
jgi:quinol monooxygenase YgiN